MELQNVITKLQYQGFRITNGRKWILKFLFKKHCPLSATDLHHLLAEKHINLNLSTVYRELQFLKGQTILRDIFFKDGIQRFELADEGHHHHLVCTDCKKVEPIELGNHLEELEREVGDKRSFKIDHHSLEFYGTCGSCTTARS